MDQSNKIELIAFQKDQSDRLIFVNFSNSDNKQAFKRVPLRVSYLKKSFELDVRFIVVSSLSEIEHHRLSKSQRLCELATFLVQADYSNKLFIELFLSDYTLALLKDDWDEDRKIHLFEIDFKKNSQRSGHSIQNFKSEKTLSLDLISEFDGTGIFNAEITSHQSMRLHKYKELTGSDPISKKALETYFDPDMHEELSQRFSLMEYLKLEQQR